MQARVFLASTCCPGNNDIPIDVFLMLVNWYLYRVFSQTEFGSDALWLWHHFSKAFQVSKWNLNGLSIFDQYICLICESIHNPPAGILDQKIIWTQNCKDRCIFCPLLHNEDNKVHLLSDILDTNDNLWWSDFFKLILTLNSHTTDTHIHGSINARYPCNVYLNLTAAVKTSRCQFNRQYIVR